MKCNVLILVDPFFVFYFVLFYSSIPKEISSVSVDVECLTVTFVAFLRLLQTPIMW